MVSELDLFSNATPHRFEKVDVNNLITDVIKIFKAPLESSSGITLSFTPNPEVPPISTSAPGLKQILINLIKNSSEAIDREGSIRITTSLVTQTDNDKTSSLASPGVQICIEDSGPGIPEKVLRNLFKPFTTTKGPEHSGLGLSIVKKTVADLRGALDCQSSPHAGTSFTIRLPLTKATMQAERITEVT
jgi:hypothetical protein